MIFSEKKINEAVLNFNKEYSKYMLDCFGSDFVPKTVLHNCRAWDYYHILNLGNFNNEDIVLDTGALHTYFCLYLMQFVKKIWVTDNFYWSNRAYNKLEKLFTAEEWKQYITNKGKDKIISENADITNLTYQENFFDKVLCISTIEHVVEDDKAINELFRVLKPGGKLFITTEFNEFKNKPYSELDGSYYRIYDNNLISKLLENKKVDNIFISGSYNKNSTYTTLFISIIK